MESRGLNGQQCLDVCAAREDALQVDPAPLDVDPHVKQRVDAIQLLLPRYGLLFKHLYIAEKTNR